MIYGGRLINGIAKNRTIYREHNCISVKQIGSVQPYKWPGFEVEDCHNTNEVSCQESIYYHYTHPLLKDGFWYTGELPEEPYLSILILRYPARSCEMCSYFEYISDWGNTTGECRNKGLASRLRELHFTGYIGVSTYDFCDLWEPLKEGTDQYN
jgi:hypothetical protein